MERYFRKVLASLEYLGFVNFVVSDDGKVPEKKKKSGKNAHPA
jgi:hypothetical protein